MDILKWLAGVAGFNDRLRRKVELHPQFQRRLARRALASRVSQHLLRDIGADDG